MGDSLNETAPVSECPSRDSHSLRVQNLANSLQPNLDRFNPLHNLDGFNPLHVARQILREEYADSALYLYAVIFQEEDRGCDDFTTVQAFEDCASSFIYWLENRRNGGRYPREISVRDEQILFPLSRLIDENGDLYEECMLRYEEVSYYGWSGVESSLSITLQVNGEDVDSIGQEVSEVIDSSVSYTYIDMAHLAYLICSNH